MHRLNPLSRRGPSRLRIYPVVSRTHVAKLRLLLRNSEGQWEGFGMLGLCIVAMGAMEAAAQNKNAWFLRLRREILIDRATASLGDAQEQLKTVTWIVGIHMPKYKASQLALLG